ncbi:MAG: hypothetical protein ACLP51_13650 [Syntrophobacteraceae bacterium]
METSRFGLGENMAVQVDLFTNFVEQLRTRFSMDAGIDKLEVVIRYAWFDLRRLTQKKWKVCYSKELLQNPFFISNGMYIDQIRHKAESGQDLTPHASTLVEKIEGRDELLADWGLYHLHPGHGTKPASIQGFVNRASELLFVFPNNDLLFFLDVLDHKSWTNFHLIAVIDNNWPSAIDSYRLKDVIGLAHEPTETELYNLRKNQINTFFRVGNSFFGGPGGGIATSGVANKAAEMALNVSKLLNDYSQQLIKEESDIRKLIAKKLGTAIQSDPLYCELVEYNLRKGTGKIIEKNSNIEFPFHFE